MSSENAQTSSLSSSDHFSDKDMDLLSRAVELVPQLLLATRFAKLAKERLTFPVQGKTDLGPLFGDGDVLVIGTEKFSRSLIERFLPEELFPVESAEASIGVALGAICWSAVVHGMESFVTAQATGLPPFPPKEV